MTLREFEDYGYKRYFNQVLDRLCFDMAGTGGCDDDCEISDGSP